VVAVRILFTIAAILLVIGSALDGNYTDSSSVSIGQKLVQAGYLVFASILGILIIFHIYLWQRTARLTETDIIVSSHIGTIAKCNFD
jgi:tellurite resistance protein TehA-like permease